MPRELMHPEIEWVNPPNAVEPGTRQGRESVEAAQSAVVGAYSSIGIEVERQVELGDSAGLIVEMIYRGRGSGIEVRQRMGFVFTIRDGRITRFEWSNDPEALIERFESRDGG
jgi:ketosteroid isomerase-like protein